MTRDFAAHVKQLQRDIAAYRRGLRIEAGVRIAIYAATVAIVMAVWW